MGDWEELKRKVRGIESKLEVRCERGEWAIGASVTTAPEPRVDVVFGDWTGRCGCGMGESARMWLNWVVEGDRP